MGDVVSVRSLWLLCFLGGVNGDTLLGVAEFAGVLLVSTCCHFWGTNTHHTFKPPHMFVLFNLSAHLSFNYHKFLHT